MRTVSILIISFLATQLFAEPTQTNPLTVIDYGSNKPITLVKVTLHDVDHVFDIATDTFESLKPLKVLRINKERLNAVISAWGIRLVNKLRDYSKMDKWHDFPIGWFLWKLNLKQRL